MKRTLNAELRIAEAVRRSPRLAKSYRNAPPWMTALADKEIEKRAVGSAERRESRQRARLRLLENS